MTCFNDNARLDGYVIDPGDGCVFVLDDDDDLAGVRATVHAWPVANVCGIAAARADDRVNVNARLLDAAPVHAAVSVVADDIVHARLLDRAAACAAGFGNGNDRAVVPDAVHACADDTVNARLDGFVTAPVPDAEAFPSSITPASTSSRRKKR